MQKDIKQEESLSPEVQEIMKNIISAIRSVRLYPPNNPVYFNTVKKSFDALNNYLHTGHNYHIGVQKNFFSINNIPFGKESELNKPIAHDLFIREIREIVFSYGLNEAELLQFYKTLALPAEEIKMKGGISSIIWENNSSHVKITEAKLDEVITTQVARGWDKKEPAEKYEPQALQKTVGFSGRTLVLTDLTADPTGFSASMIELARQTKAENETIEDRLFALYKEAGRKIDEGDPSRRETLYEGLAKSVLSLDPLYRNGFIASKLYGEYDAEMAEAEEEQGSQYLPSIIHEVQTGRFSDNWTVQQVATLLKRTAAQHTGVTSLPQDKGNIEVIPIDQETIEITKDMNTYSAEYMEEIQALTDMGNETDVTQFSTWTLISLISLLNDPQYIANAENKVKAFTDVMQQIEKALGYFLEKKDYEFTTQIVQALQLPLEASLRTMVNEVIKKALPKSSITAAIEEMRKNPKESSQYHFAHSYLTAFEQESTQVLLELLAEEKDRSLRLFYLELVKDIGKNQITLLGRHLSDVRWYFVRNIVIVLGESKTDQALAFLKRISQHQNARIRKEVIQGLISIGGRKAVSVLATFLTDKDDEVKKDALRAFSSIPDIGAKESKFLIDFLDRQPFKKKEQDFTIEAIKSLGKIGDHSSEIFLKRYDRIRWWKSRKRQEELRRAAKRAMEEISRR